MMHKRIAVLFLAGMIGSANMHAMRASQQEQPQSHIAWVVDALIRMQTIKPSMTRSDLLKVFTTEGGLSTRLHRTFVSRDCPYFKVDVEFEADPQTLARDARVPVIDDEDARDIIVKISKPYMAFSTTD
jgi:hypothetical protein